MWSVGGWGGVEGGGGVRRAPVNQISTEKGGVSTSNDRITRKPKSWLSSWVEELVGLRFIECSSLYRTVSQTEGEDKRYDKREKISKQPHQHLLQAQLALALLSSKLTASLR